MGAPPDLTKIQTAVVDFFERQKRPYEMDRGRTTCWRNGHFSFNVGRSRAFGSKKVVTGQNMRRDKSRIYDACKEAFPDFPFDGVQVNRNFQCKPHRDRLNVGDSLLFAFGDYTGGALVVEGREIDARTPYVFDAHANTHWVAPFEGTRYSVVLFPLGHTPTDFPTGEAQCPPSASSTPTRSRPASPTSRSSGDTDRRSRRSRASGIGKRSCSRSCST
jgi:hypothetical protein